MLVDTTDGSQDRCNGLLANSRMEVELPGPQEKPATLEQKLCGRQSDTASVAYAAAQTLRHIGLIFILRYGSERTMSYSYRSATVGSTRIARRAGTQHATTATPIHNIAVNPNVIESLGLKPDRSRASSLAKPSDMARPIKMPMKVSFSP